MSSSTFLAHRTILQLARDEAKLCFILEKHICADDLVVSCENLENAGIIKPELMTLLRKGGFVLGKWASYNREFLTNLSQHSLHINSCSFDNNDNLNVRFEMTTFIDNFSYSVLSFIQICSINFVFCVVV